MPAQIFGRDAELRTIGAFLTALPREPGALVLAGPAGAGKTTLLRAGAAQAAADGFTVLATAPARGDLRLAFAGLSDLLEPWLDAVIAELPPPQARALQVALLLRDASALPPEPRVIAAAFRSAVAVLARSAPVLLVIDDVQWLDAPTGAAVGFAIRRLEHEPAGLLCVQRTARPAEELPLELGRAYLPAGLLPVGGLEPGALHRLLRDRLGTSFSHPTLRRIETGSAGNPFIALEIGRALARRGITSVGTGALPVPDTLTGLVAEHLGELPPAVLDAARLVAVIPDAPIGQYLAAGAAGADLDAAVLAGVLEPAGGRLRFAHPLIASAVTGSIPPARHRQLHLAAARIARRPEEQARHRALAADAPSAPVAAELDDAARTAAARGAPATAAELSALAATLTPPDYPADTRRRHLDAARQLVVAGETSAARTTLEKLIASTQPSPDRAAALSQLAALQEDDFAAASAALLGQALEEAGDDPARTADIHLSLSVTWMLRGDVTRSRAETRQALADAERAGDFALLAACLTNAFEADMLSGGGAEDERELERALELEQAVGMSPLRTSPSQIAGIWYFIQGRLAEAEAMQRRVLARADAQGVEEWRVDALNRLSRIAGRRGDAAEAARLAADGLQIAEQIGLPLVMIAQLHASASAALLLGQVETVREAARRGMELAESAGTRPYLVMHESLLGSLDLALGDYPAAASRLRPLASQILRIGWHPTTQSIAPDVVEALIAAGELDEADAFLSAVERGMPDPATSALTARCRGALAAARGDLDAAVARLTEALRLHDQISPQPMERGRTLLVLGGVQRRAKQRGAARATLSEAIGIFEAISAPLWAARARADLARVSGRAPGSDELTVAEQRVAHLVTRGMTNREIAAELFVTVRTVEATLTRSYAKLGVRSRTELAARMHGG